MASSVGRRDIDRTLLALVGITVLALVARLVFLGERIAHWDEGRVAFGILRFLETGAYEYRPIVHGPFLPHVNRAVFAVIGANDFSARLVVALIGGLLPLAAWLYRDHLDDIELVALAGFLALDPVLLYYSRFMRNDVPVAAFMFVGLGLLLRLHATGRHRYLYGAVAAIALAFTAKENAILYPVSVLGALVLLLDHRLFLARDGDPPWTRVAVDRVRTTLRGLWVYRYAIVAAAFEFVAIIALFYAPRSGDGGGLVADLTDPTRLARTLEAGTIGAADQLVSGWITSGHLDHGYLPFLGHYLEVLWYASGPLALLAVLGFVVDRYAGDRPRDLVALAFYWGFVSVLGYPIAADIKAAWIVAHAVVPLAIPAAVGVGLLVRWGRDAYRLEDTVSVGLATLVVVLLVGQLVAAGLTTSYLSPQSEDNVLVQYAQPEGEMRPALDAVHRAARDNEGLDVLWYGDHFLVENESEAHRLPVNDGEWYNRLPLPWYLEAFNATVDSTDDTGDLITSVESDGTPVIITRDDEAAEIRNHLDGYGEYTYELRQFDLDVVFFIDDRYPVDEPAG